MTRFCGKLKVKAVLSLSCTYVLLVADGEVGRIHVDMKGVVLALMRKAKAALIMTHPTTPSFDCTIA
jgi:hypothetical protein